MAGPQGNLHSFVIWRADQDDFKIGMQNMWPRNCTPPSDTFDVTCGVPFPINSEDSTLCSLDRKIMFILDLVVLGMNLLDVLMW